MYNYSGIFSKIKTPDTWKEKLYSKIAEEKEKPRLRVKKLAVTAAAAAAVFALTLTVTAAAGILDIGSILRSGLGDKVSSEKILSENYQPLDVSGENELVSVKAAALLGDTNDSFIILEAKPKKVPDNLRRFGLDAVIFDSSAACDENYIGPLGRNRYFGVPQTDENGEETYIFRIRSYPFWTRNALENDLELTVRITGVCYDYLFSGETPVVMSKSSKIDLSFVPDKNVISEAVSVPVGKEVIIDSCICTVTDFLPSDYCERIVIDYNVPDDFERDSGILMWSRGTRFGRKLLRVSGDKRTFADTCGIKLIADGENIPYLENDLYLSENQSYSCPMNILGWTDDDTKFSIILYFEPFDYDAAESVVLRIRTSEDTFSDITVKS